MAGKVIPGANYVTPFRIDTSFGLTLLVGPNGVGKSNILSALRYAIDADSSERLIDNRPKSGPRRRSIGVKTIFSALKNELSACSEGVLKLDFQRENRDRIAISRTFTESFSKTSRATRVSYEFTQHKKLYLDEYADSLYEIEDLCTRQHLLISLKTLPQWSEEGEVLVRMAEQTGLPALDLLNEFNSIVNEELGLNINLGSQAPENYELLTQLFRTSTDQFGENPLTEQGRGVQASLVYALSLAIIRLRARLLIGRGVTLLLEEPENGIHIGLQRRLIEALDKSSSESMDCSIIISTNSPFLIPQSPNHRIFEIAISKIEEKHVATTRKNFLRDSPVAQHWLESDDSITEALWSLLDSRSVARVLDLFRKSQPSSQKQIIIVEGYLDKLYIETALHVTGQDGADFRVMTSGESLELRTKDTFEEAGVWLLALQILLAYGWAERGEKIRAITDADEVGLLTARSVGYLISGIKQKTKKPDHLDIRISHTNFAEEHWHDLFKEKAVNGDFWITTEFEDLWPKSYLEKYFSSAPPENMEARRVSIFVEGEDDDSWSEMEVEDRHKCLPIDLHPLTLTKTAKNRREGSQYLFEDFIRDTQPSKDEALIFLRRLSNILKSRPSFGNVKLIANE